MYLNTYVFEILINLKKLFLARHAIQIGTNSILFQLLTHYYY